MYPQDFLFIFHGFLCFLVYGSSISHTRRGLGAGVTQVADFDCPEEFGYYPHPTDCTQYYVCVFGGALLESCTGGLMYSHELQTCDWPRNVICGESNGGDGGTISTVRVTDPRTRNPQQSQNLNHIQQNQGVQVQISSNRNSQRQEFNRPLQQEVIQQTLYTEDFGPAEEVESDRQQRVYRGQSSVIGSVQRERDSFRSLKNSNVRNQNNIPTGPSSQDKISVVSFGSNRPSAPSPQEQYSDLTTNTAEYSFDLVLNKSTDNITKKIFSRSKRQIFSRHGLHQATAPRISYVPVPDRDEISSTSFLNYNPTMRKPYYNSFYTGGKLQIVYPIQMYHPKQQQSSSFYPHQYVARKQYRNESMLSNKHNVNEELIRLTKSTIQSEFKPIRSSGLKQEHKLLTDMKMHKVEFGKTSTNSKPTPSVRTKIKVNTNKPKTTGNLRQKFITAAGFIRMSTEQPSQISPTMLHENYKKKYLINLAKKNQPTSALLTRNTVTVPPTLGTTSKPKLYRIEKPKDYDIRHQEMEANKEKKNTVYNASTMYQNKYFTYSKPQEYEYYEYEEDEEEEEEKEKKEEQSTEKNFKRFPINKDEGKEKDENFNEQPIKAAISIHLNSGNISFFDFIEKAGFTDADEIKAAIKTKMPSTEMTTKETQINFNNEAFYVPKKNLNSKINLYPLYTSEITTENPRFRINQIEAPKRQIPEEYYENFKPSPTQSLYLTKVADNYDDDTDENYRQHPVTSYLLLAKKRKVEQVKLTSALPPLSPSPRPSIERYNSSQRFQTSQFDPFYAAYDDVDIYRENDYGQQQFKSPSSTPSSNIVHQYRGQTTYSKQQAAIQEPLQQQQHLNTYTQDIYSPPPVIQDYNDQYNVQIDDQYQQLSQPTLKPPSRSETTNSSKNESSVSVTLVPENVTVKSESSPIIRRSDSSTFFSISSFGPSTVLLPPYRYPGVTTPKFLDTTFSTPKSEKPIYSSTSSFLKESGQNNFEPPKNGPFAKTLNSFDSLLSSFIAAVSNTNRGTPPPGPSTTPPTPIPPKTSPETIVRSEIGRINHQPIVITENFKIRQPTLRKPIEPKVENNRPIQSVVTSLPSLSSTTVPVQNDYLAYYVELEPKNHKVEKPPRGFFAKPIGSSETTTEPTILTKDNLGFGQTAQVNFNLGQNNKPVNNFVRVLTNNSNQKVKLGATLDLESIEKGQEKKKTTQESENDTIEKQTLVGPISPNERPYQSVGKWVIAKNEFSQKPGRFSSTVRQNPFAVYSQELQREQITFRDKIEAITEAIKKEKQKELESVLSRGRGNIVHVHSSTEPELPATTVVSGPYKFLYVNLDSTTEHLSTPTPFSRNPENEDRNRYIYKTNPESRVRPKYYVTTTEKEEHSEDPAEGSTETLLLNIENIDSDDKIRFNYKTNPESRFRSRYIGSSSIIADDKTVENVRIIPKITVPEIKPEVKPVTVLREKPIQALPVEEEREEEFIIPIKKAPEFPSKNIEAETTSAKSYGLGSSTIIAEVEANTEEVKKPLPRRIVKIHRNDLKNQRLAPIKVKKFKKPATKSPLAVLEELEEKTLLKENEIHTSYRPIIVGDDLDFGKNKSGFRFTLENEKDFNVVPDNKIVPVIVTTEKFIVDTIPRGFSVKPSTVSVVTESDVTEKEVPVSNKPLSLFPKRPHTLKNVTQLFENRATTKAYQRKFKPSDFKLRLRPTTASPDSESTPGPHLSTRQPQLYTIGSTGNEISVSRGTPAPNRGTRPTLKPSTAIVSKASEFIDIYRYPPRRPQNLYATPTPDKSAAKCRKDVCLLPDCNCGGKDIPGGYNPEEIPQLVLLTFDDSVNDLNKGLYADLFERGRVNPNGCPISATFYVSHEWTDYSQVQNLYANGHEIASHSITHSFGEQFSQKKWTKEIAGQREILAAYGGVRLEDIRGMRAPFLAVGGNKMFKMLYDSNFTYDSSMPIYENRPPSWPYTLDYKLFHDCMIPPCPTKSYPGVWEVPMVMWQDLNGGRCSMGDACSNPPTAEGVYKMLIKNFERHFTTNRAPFGLYYHAAWFTHEHHKEGFIAFLDTIVNMPEVWLVTTWQAIEWVRDPQPLSTVQNFPPFQCNVEKAKKCNNPKVCNLWHKSGVRYMRTCQPCPDVYPWAGKTGVKNSRVDNEIIEE